MGIYMNIKITDNSDKILEELDSAAKNING